MAERNSEVKWDQRREFISNQPRNEKPILVDVEVQQDSLLPQRRRGEAFYVYDFGGSGEVGNLEWDGEGFVSFRYKVADTREELNQTEFIGSDTDRFVGQTLDTSRWSGLPGPYVVIQNNELQITGATDDSQSVYQKQGVVELQSDTEFPTAFEVRMKLEKLPNSSGSKVFMGVTDGNNTIILRKFYEKLKASASQGTVNTNVGNRATLVVTRGGTLIFQDNNVKKVTDGILEKIDFEDIPTNAIDTLVNLKRYASFDDINSIPRPYGVSAEAIPFRVRGDYNPTQTVSDFRKYAHYDIIRDAGFYRATMPVINKKLDLYETQIKSFNWNPETRKYEEADTNNLWKIALTLPPGVHRYNFWVDGVEKPDTTNPNSYYLNADNQKVSIFTDGYGYDDGVNIPDGAPFFSELILEETQTVEFVFQDYGKKVALVGTFNDYSPTRHLMAQEVDRQLIRRLADPNFIYVNGNTDYHKIEITLPYRMSIDTIDFVTLIPLDHKQRVKIFLDNVAVTKLDWNLVPVVDNDTEVIEGSGTGSTTPIVFIYGYGYGFPITGYGVAYGYSSGYGADYSTGYGYGDLFGYGTGVEKVCPILQDASCNELFDASTTFSYWDNNSDTITASEDGTVRWCLKDGLTRTAQKITFYSRIEAATSKVRKHVSLDFHGTIYQAHTVTDYAFSDSYALVQKTHTTHTSPLQQWQFPVLNLFKGQNELTPTTYDSQGNPIFGDPVVINVEKDRPSAWELNRSEWAGHAIEIIYGIAGRLRAVPLKIASATDDSSLNIVSIPQPTHRFVNLNFSKTVELINVEVDPNITLYVKMVGQYSTFELQFYETLMDADNNLNVLGTVQAAEYGAEYPADFSSSNPVDGRPNFFLLDKKISQNGILTEVVVGNIVATYQRGGGNKIIKIGQIR